MHLPVNFLNSYRDVGALLLRMFIGCRLVYGVMDNVVDWHHMLRFRDFLQQFRFPLPLVAAMVSVYCQLIAGILILLGACTRLAAFIMLINFLVALLAVHWGQSVEEMTPALAVFFCCLLFIFQGAGKYSVDIWWAKQNRSAHQAI